MQQLHAIDAPSVVAALDFAPGHDGVWRLQDIPMHHQKFKTGLIRLYGPGFRKEAAFRFKVTESTIDRWVGGYTAIPGPAEALLAELLKAGKEATQ